MHITPNAKVACEVMYSTEKVKFTIKKDESTKRYINLTMKEFKVLMNALLVAWADKEEEQKENEEDKDEAGSPVSNHPNKALLAQSTKRRGSTLDDYFSPKKVRSELSDTDSPLDLATEKPDSVSVSFKKTFFDTYSFKLFKDGASI